jgi:hypothetical protein
MKYTAFPRQQSLLERATKLRYTYTGCHLVSQPRRDGSTTTNLQNSCYQGPQSIFKAAICTVCIYCSAVVQLFHYSAVVQLFYYSAVVQLFLNSAVVQLFHNSAVVQLFYCSAVVQLFYFTYTEMRTNTSRNAQ